MKYFLFKTRRVCHPCPGELTHAKRKCDTNRVFFSLGNLLDLLFSLVLSLLSHFV